MIYLDAAATSALHPEVLEAMWPYLTTQFGNPSSHNELGDAAARGLADARAEIASILGCRPGEIVFTSGGTEADNLAIKGIALASPRGRRLVTTRIEHEAVLESARYLERFHDVEVAFAETDSKGRVTPDALAAVVGDDTALVSIAYANNEVGTVQPIPALADAAHRTGAVFHTDAVQAAGWLDLSVRTLGVDALSVSGHKLGAPKGIGFLYVRGRVPLEPVIHGGGQERGRRSGTENVAAAVGLAAALRLRERERAEVAGRARLGRDEFVAAVLARVPDARLTGDPDSRLPASASFVFPGTGGELVLLELERRGIVSSSGAACAAGSEEASHVLVALGFPEELARTAVRFTWGPDTTAAELVPVAEAVAEAVFAIRALAD